MPKKPSKSSSTSTKKRIPKRKHCNKIRGVLCSNKGIDIRPVFRLDTPVPSIIKGKKEIDEWIRKHSSWHQSTDRAFIRLMSKIGGK